MWKLQHHQEWQKSPWTATIPLQRLRHVPCFGTKAQGKKKQKSIILKAYHERMSLRGLSRVFGVHRQSISMWIKEHVQDLPAFKSTLLASQPDDVLEFDEAWSFVLKKINKR